MKPTLKLGVAALIATLGLPSTTPAQQRLPTLVAVAEADSLHGAAVSLVQTTHRWRDAARLHRRSAGLRSIDDPQAFGCLRVAAALSYATKDRTKARNDLTEAAIQALHRGDLEQAAQAYVDVAWVAQEQGKAAEVRKFGKQAEVLAASPLLDAVQRGAILKRITHTAGDLAVTR